MWCCSDLEKYPGTDIPAADCVKHAFQKEGAVVSAAKTPLFSDNVWVVMGGGNLDNTTGAAITSSTYNPKMAWNSSFTFSAATARTATSTSVLGGDAERQSHRDHPGPGDDPDRGR